VHPTHLCAPDIAQLLWAPGTGSRDNFRIYLEDVNVYRRFKSVKGEFFSFDILKSASKYSLRSIKVAGYFISHGSLISVNYVGRGTRAT
jgi:hypothetical protein